MPRPVFDSSYNRQSSDSLPPVISDLYDKLPKLDCKGLCARSCGPILVAPREFTEVEENIAPVKIPTRGIVRMPQSGEPAVLFKADKKQRCPMLRSGRCTIYEHRPLICRLWGSVESMRCPYGCVPDRWLTELEAREMLARTTGSTLGAKLIGE